ncbi:uncharacterized protein LOC111104607 [Crassostrea virginica]
MDVTSFFLLIAFHFESHTSQECPQSDGSFACCYGHVWSLKQGKCIPCMDGYIGVNCTQPCPDFFYGKHCTSRCNCNIEWCNNVYGCRVLQDSTTELRVLQSLSTRQAQTKSTYSVKCHEKRKQKGFPAFAVSVICACLISLFASFMIVYIVLHCYMISHEPAQMSSPVDVA